MKHRIKEFRDMLGMSQKEFAEVFYPTCSFISDKNQEATNDK